MDATLKVCNKATCEASFLSFLQHLDSFSYFIGDVFILENTSDICWNHIAKCPLANHSL